VGGLTGGEAGGRRWDVVPILPLQALLQELEAVHRYSAPSPEDRPPAPCGCRGKSRPRYEDRHHCEHGHAHQEIAQVAFLPPGQLLGHDIDENDTGGERRRADDNELM